MDDDAKIRERLETSSQRANRLGKWEKTLLLGCAFVASLTFTIALIVVTWNLVPALDAWKKSSIASAEKVPEALDNVNATLTVGSKQLELLGTSAKNNLDKTGRVFDALRTGTLPKINSNLLSLTTLEGALTDTVHHSDASINEKLVPMIANVATATTKLMDKYGLTADEASKAIAMASEKSGKSIDALTAQIADPRWSRAADNLVATAGSANKLAIETTATIADVHTDLHDTMKQMPHTMAQVDKTATNIAKFSKITIIAGIISNLANGLLPGLLH